jgi:hypothetical protein
MALSTSAAMALESATRSWLARESLRTRRPNHRAGNTTHTSTTATCSITHGLVQTSMASAPMPMTALRSPMLSEEPTTVLHQRRVCGQARQHLAGLCGLEELGALLQHMGIDGVAQIRSHPVRPAS